MQAMHAAADTLHMPWLIPVMVICMFLAPSSRLTSGWWIPFICYKKPLREDNLLGDRIGKLHPVRKTPVFALIVQAIIVTILYFSNFISPRVAVAYWMLTELTTITYFIPYLVIFSAF